MSGSPGFPVTEADPAVSPGQAFASARVNIAWQAEPHRRVAGAFELEPHERAVLALACRQADDIAELE